MARLLLSRLIVPSLLTACAFAESGAVLWAVSAGPVQQKESRAEAEKKDFHFIGEVARGKEFAEDIGHDLVFRLGTTPGYTDIGWKIEIVPRTMPEDGPVEFSAVATPPYRSYNPRYLEATYGNTAKMAVGITPRAFYFVESVDDEHYAEECLNAAMYPTNVSDEEKVRVVQEQGHILLGKGELHILKSRIGRGKNPGDAGTIDWLRFSVDIEFASGKTMGDILAVIARPQ